MTRHGALSARRARFIPIVALALIVVLALAVLATGFGSSGDPAGRDGRPGPGEPRAGAATALSPAETVTTFYRRASAGDYRGAWGLAAPRFRRQLGGYEEFRARMAPLESVAFRRGDPIAEERGAARLSVRAVADYTDGIDRCRGVVRLVRGGATGWLIESARISCPESTRPRGAGALGTEEQLAPRSAATEATVAPTPQPVAPERQMVPSSPAETDQTAPVEPSEPAETPTPESAPTDERTSSPTEPDPGSGTDSGTEGSGDGGSGTDGSGNGDFGGDGSGDGGSGGDGSGESGEPGASAEGTGE